MAEKKQVTQKAESYVPRLRTHYRSEVAPKLRKEFGLGNVMATPKLEKIVLNMGVGEAIRRAKKSIASFKLREEMPIGCSVTLRGDRMWDFLDRLVSIALPRVRDFRGIPTKSFDGRGNYTMGIRDHLIFQEIDFNKVDKSKGMNVTFVTTAENDEQALHLLRELGLPFARN